MTQAEQDEVRSAPAPRPRRGPGPLVVVGGAEDKVGPSAVLRRFVRLAGGEHARVAVLPTASSVETEMLEVYRDVFTRLGVAQVLDVRPGSRAEADDPDLAAAVDGCTGAFMTGGNQLRLSQVVTGTALGRTLHALHGRGMVVGGTSAGASIMTQHMISMGGEGVTPRHRHAQLTAGLGLLPGVVVDQHFDERARYGRLVSVVAGSPSLLGVGIDEDTAAVVTRGRYLEVVGRGGVFVVDAARATTNAHEARPGAPLLVSGAVVHTLPAGARFDLERRELMRFTERRADRAVRGDHADRDEATSLAERLRAPLQRRE